MEEDYIIGTFLHPNYKQLHGASNTQITDCRPTCRQLIHHEQPTNDIVEEIYEPPTKKTKPCMSTLMGKQKNDESGSDEIDRYINLKLDEHEQYNNPLGFWRKNEYQSMFPNLARVARRYFVIPCSSAALERQFGATGQIITQRRSNLNHTTVNDIIFIRSMEKQNFEMFPLLLFLSTQVILFLTK
jgi:hypothetical protein